MIDQVFWLAFFAFALALTLFWKRVGEETLRAQASFLARAGIALNAESPRLRRLYRVSVLLGGITVSAAALLGWWYEVPTSLGFFFR